MTALTDDRFVVAWVDAGGGDKSEIKLQIFNSGGSKAGSETLVNANTSVRQGFIDIETLSDGRFVITWSDLSASSNLDSTDLRRQIFNQDGTVSTPEFAFDTDADIRISSIAALPDGTFVVVYSNHAIAYSGVFAQVFASDGSRIDSELALESDLAGRPSNVQVTALPNGNFVVQWQATGATGVIDIHLQTYTSDGAAVGGETIIAGNTSYAALVPTVTALEDGWLVYTRLGGGRRCGQRKRR